MRGCAAPRPAPARPQEGSEDAGEGGEGHGEDEGEESDEGWTGALDTGFVEPAGGGAAARVAPQAPRRSGPSQSFREGIAKDALLCMPGDEDDEAADGESIWYVNALGPQEKNNDTVQCGPCKLAKRPCCTQCLRRLHGRASP